MGQRISQPRQHQPLSAGLYDSESSKEDQETHAGKTRPATKRLDYGWMNPPDEQTPEETHDVYQTLPHQQKIYGIYTTRENPPPQGGTLTGRHDADEREGVYTTGPTAQRFGCAGPSKCIVPRQLLARWPLSWPDQGTTSYLTTKVWLKPHL